MLTEVPLVAEDIAPEETEALLERVAVGIVSRSLTTPAVIALEMCKPLNFLGSQAMLALQPFVSAFIKPDGYRKLALILERDRNVERLMERIERLDSEGRASRRENSEGWLSILKRRILGARRGKP